MTILRIFECGFLIIIQFEIDFANICISVKKAKSNKKLLELLQKIYCRLADLDLQLEILSRLNPGLSMNAKRNV